MELIIISIALVIALAVIYWVKNNLNTENKISRKTGIKSLGNIPLNDNNMELLIESNPKANIKEYIKDIRNNIQKESSEQVISFISATTGAGKSWVSNNIAISLARINKKVLLIDANLTKKSTKNEIFYVEKSEGFSNFIKDLEPDNKLSNLNKVKKYIKQTQIPNLHILQNGTTSEYANELLKTNNAKKIISLLKEIFDYIILDGTAYDENKSCLKITALSDTSIIVVDNNTKNYNLLKELKEDIICNRGKILGYILNKTNIKKGKHYNKNNENNYGIYIETNHEETKQPSLDEIIPNTYSFFFLFFR